MAENYPKRLFHPAIPACVEVHDEQQEKDWKEQGWLPEQPGTVQEPSLVDPPADQALGVPTLPAGEPAPTEDHDEAV